MFFIYIDYTLVKTPNCPGNEIYGVVSVAFDSTYLLASGSSDKTVKLWDKNSGNQLRSLTGHAGDIWAVTFDSNGMLVSGSEDSTIKLWSNETRVLLRTLIGHDRQIRSLAFDSTYLLASGSYDNPSRGPRPGVQIDTGRGGRLDEQPQEEVLLVAGTGGYCAC